MKFTNKEIYEKTAEITAVFSNEKKYIPVKLNFAIQKNLLTFSKLQEEIERNRIHIAETHGELNSERNQYDIKKEYIEKVTQELEDLFNIEQEVDVKTCSLSQIEGIDLTMEQMQAIMFMITED